MPRVEVEIRSDAGGIAADWRDLVGRAPPNVFMDPAATDTANDLRVGRTRTLLAWDGSGETRRLVGLWTLAGKRFGPAAYLSAPQHRFAFVSNPVIDAGWTDAVTVAFFDAIAANRDLPNVIRVRYLDGDCPTGAAIVRAAEARPHAILSERLRAFATRDTGAKRSGSTRKKLRQSWNRLAAEGSLEIVNRRDAKAACEDFETFLKLEQASWKGAASTAFLSNAGTARYARTTFAALATAGNASVALLTFDGTPIACQVLLTCGSAAYTWKTAFDTRYEKYSPGALLIDRLTEQLLADGFEQIESCSPEAGFMTTLWPGRRKTVDIAIDLSGRRSVTFRLLVAGVRAYAWAKATRDRLKAWRAGRHPAPAGAPATPPVVAETPSWSETT